jgi:hypothetical protein
VVANPRRARFFPYLFLAALLLPAAGYGAGAKRAAALPFERTEVREPCASFVATKQPFFGETHLHTAYSFDAVALDTRNTAADAYRYARGERVGLPPWADTRSEAEEASETPSGEPTQVTPHDYCFPGEHCQYMATRTIQFPEGRALDFAAITDHAEQFGEGNICTFEGTEPCGFRSRCQLPDQECSVSRLQALMGAEGVCVPKGWSSQICKDARQEIPRLRGGAIPSLIAGLENVAENPSRPPFCGKRGELCRRQAKLVWDQIRADAEAAYDRSSACTFTSFVAYEYTAMAADGKCAEVGKYGDGFPCWDQAQANAEPNVPDRAIPSRDCPSQQSCILSFTGSSGADNLHRNVIFRNDDVIDRPISNVEIPLGCGYGNVCADPGSPVASPAAMLQALEDECTDNPRKPRCDVLTIPHNSNLSRGSMFMPPDGSSQGLAEARLRNQFEPLVELIQIKGQSECRFNATSGLAWTTPPDELCDFENMSFARLGAASEGFLHSRLLEPNRQDLQSIPPRSYVRNTLQTGIQYEASYGINPFRLGFVGGLDNHNGTPGQSDAAQYAKSGAHGVQSFAVSGQALNERFYLGLETAAGGLTVAWAEENSRDAIFTALARRETYATSGTRPIVRFFGGFELPADICASGDFAARGYEGGVPMGGCLGASDGDESCKQGAGPPAFALLAMKDAGWPGHPGTNLQRAQIIKGWVDESGATHEAVYDVAGDPNDGASVDLATCTPIGGSAAPLCSRWVDPDFDPDQHAFYYARVLEDPSCRWNQFYCNARQIDCSQPLGTCRSEGGENGSGCNSSLECGGGVCTPPESYEEYEYQQCCSDPPLVPSTVQQRAWTSPIWYAP